MSIREKLQWGGVSGTNKELVTAAKLAAMKNAHGFLRVLGVTTPGYTGYDISDGGLHIYRVQSLRLMVGGYMEADTGGGYVVISVFLYDGAGGPSIGTNYGSASIGRANAGFVQGFETINLDPAALNNELWVRISSGGTGVLEAQDFIIIEMQDPTSQLGGTQEPFSQEVF